MDHTAHFAPAAGAAVFPLSPRGTSGERVGALPLSLIDDIQVRGGSPSPPKEERERALRATSPKLNGSGVGERGFYCSASYGFHGINSPPTRLDFATRFTDSVLWPRKKNHIPFAFVISFSLKMSKVI